MKRAGIEGITASQLRDIVLEFAVEFTQAVEHTAPVATARRGARVSSLQAAYRLSIVHWHRNAAKPVTPLNAVGPDRATRPRPFLIWQAVTRYRLPRGQLPHLVPVHPRQRRRRVHQVALATALLADLLHCVLDELRVGLRRRECRP